MTHTRPRKPSRLERQLAWEREMERGPGIFLPLRLNNALNVRMHWAQRAKEAKWARQLTYARVYRHFFGRQLQYAITICRFGPKRMDDDGLSASLKPVRDGIADAFRVDDGDPRYTWRYEQQQAAFYGVRIQFSEEA